MSVQLASAVQSANSEMIVRAFEELVKDFKRSTLPTRRCFCCTPRDAPEDYSVYAIEEYGQRR